MKKQKSNFPSFLGRQPLSRILAAVILVVFITFATGMIVVTYRYVRSILFEQQMEYQKSVLTVKMDGFESYFQQLATFTVSPRNDEQFMSLVESSKQLTYDDTYYILSLLKTVFYSRKDLITAKLYTINDGRSYRISKDKNHVIYGNDSPDPASLAGESSNFLTCEPCDTSKGLLTIGRTLVNIRNKQPLAYIALDVDTSQMDYLAKSGEDAESILCLLDSQGRMFYSSKPDLVNETILQEIISPEHETGQVQSADIAGVPHMVVTQESEDSQWTLVGISSMEKLLSLTNRLRTIGIAITVVVLIFAVSGVLWAVKHFTAPLKTLAERMDRVGNGDFETSISIDGCSEICVLSQTFNAMTRHINTLIEKNYKARINEKTARLIALEAQINPHFLYNTLQSIATKAILGGQPEIYTMITALSGNLRYAIKGDEYALLSTELKHVGEYLLLQKTRFEERLQYQFDVIPETENFLVPKILLQPLVENSIIHGMKQSAHQTLTIRICVKIANKGMHIVVADNGCGIPKDKLDSLKQEFQNDSISCSEIGIKNLCDRLKILYNGNASLTLQSEENLGTCVEIYLPLQSSERKHDV